MSERVIELLEEIRAELDEAIDALRSDQVGVAIAKLEVVAAQLRSAAREISA